MSDTRAFEQLCDALERATSLDRLAARGTVRIALKGGGLEARSVTRAQLAVVIDRLLPAELRNRGIADGDALCANLGRALAELPDDAGETVETPDAVFARLAG